MQKMNTKKKGWLAIALFLLLFGGSWFVNELEKDRINDKSDVHVQSLKDEVEFLPREYVKIRTH